MGIHDLTVARENLKRHGWARSIVERWRERAAYALGKDRGFFEAMIPELTPWPEYGQNCPACVGRLSSMGETGLYEWDVRNPDRLTCRYCKTEYPNDNYPETGRMTAVRMGQSFSFFLTGEERAHPDDTSGRYALTWVRWPVHTSWSGILRSRKAHWCHSQLHPLARLYALTGELVYAERVAWILDLLARRYPGWLFHSYDGTYADCPPSEAARRMGEDPPGGKFPIESIVTAFSGRHNRGDHAVLNNGFWGAGRLGCSGSDGGNILEAALAYDLIREAKGPDGKPILTEEAERRIVEDLILAGCADTECWNDINNKCGPGRALSAAVGIMFGRPESIRRAIAGFEALMEEGFHFDGFCTESPSYSDMHLHLMREIPEILAGYSDPAGYRPKEGPPLKDFDPFRHFDRYRLALEGSVRMLDPNLEYPVIGDTHAGNGLSDIYAEILTDHYGPRYAGLLERSQGAPLAEKGGEYALWHRDPGLKAVGRLDLPLRTEWFPGWHVGVLRGGPASPHTAFYMNGYSHGGHRHADTLGVIYTAHGQELAADRGYIWDDPRNAWTRSTIAHNAVTVDGGNQSGKGCGSVLELFGTGAGVEVAQASANAYPQCDRYQRTCALVQIPGERTYAVDIFRVRGGKLHQYTFHCNGELVGVEGVDLSPAGEALEWLTHIRAGRPAGPFRATWECKGVRMDLRLLNPIERLLVADAPGWRSSKGKDLNAPPVQEILAERRDGDSVVSQYTSVMSPYTGARSPVISARVIVSDPETGDLGVEVKREGCTDYILSSPGGGARRFGPIGMTGRFGFASLDDHGRAVRAYLLDGTELTVGAQTLARSPGSRTLQVASCEGRTYTTTADLPVDPRPVGTYLLAGNTGFEIESVAERSLTVRDYPAIPCQSVEVLGSAELAP